MRWTDLVVDELVAAALALHQLERQSMVGLQTRIHTSDTLCQ